jgi:DNA-binding LytR/AlgR family response regulator
MQFINELLEHPSLLAYFSGANNYAWLQFRNGERRLLAKPLTYFEERLPTFIRVHKTALINPVCVMGVQHPPRPKMAGSVRMQDGIELPVSRRRWRDVLRSLETLAQQETLPMDVAVPTPIPVVKPEKPYTAPPLRVLAIMTGDATILTRECIEGLDFPCAFQAIESGAGLSSALLLNPSQNRPALIFMDARTGRSDRILTLRTLKSHPQLRAIPIVWLVGAEQDAMQAYELDANSVIVVPEDPASFVRILRQLCYYWLTMVQLPPEIAVQG